MNCALLRVLQFASAAALSSALIATGAPALAADDARNSGSGDTAGLVVGLRQTNADPDLSHAMDKSATLMTELDVGMDVSREPHSSPEQASSFIQYMGDHAEILLASYGGSEAGQSRNEFRDLINQDFDLEKIGSFAFGTAWKSATSAQQQEYQKLFAAWTIGKYTYLLGAAMGAKLTVLSAEPVAEDSTMVQTRIEWPGMGAVDFGLLVNDTKGQMKITDVIIERNVSMDLLQREDLSSVIRREGIDGLIGDLRQRVKSDEVENRSVFAARDHSFSQLSGSVR
jgi:phospholipid transport system substrate-binding protein